MEPVAQYPPNHEFRTAIIWFRRDLRVDDNPALVAALSTATIVIPVFIWAPEEEGQFQPGRCSRWWSKHSLVDLQQALAALGSRLIIRRSTDSTAALLQIVSEVGAEAVFFNHLYDPISLMRDHDCKRGLTAAGVAHRTFNGDMLYEPWEVLDAHKQPYSTFDDFWTSVRNMAVPPPFPVSAPEVMPPVPLSVSSLAVTEVDWFFTAEQEASSDQLKFKWKPGVGGAIAELERFAGERLHMFEHDRAKVDRDSTSRLSPWIHIGSISVRYIFYRIRQCQAEWLAAGVDRSKSCDDFLQQVGYREYSRYLSFHFPFIHERSLLRHLRACPWRIDQQAFKAWRQGQTGYPIIDAAMRQLWSSGWCHNRARVVAASFLVKDLLLPWQWGLKHYWDAQIDADLECDALGWQYVSGGMSDAHPFSYMMDLEVEARRFDPDGEYVRRWLPVLSRLPTQYIHAPWKAPSQVLASADVELGCNYPAPIISRVDAKANVDYACSVLDKCVVAQSSESSGRYPYRAPTYPGAPGGAGASSGANPTGTAGCAGPSAGTGAGTGTGTGTGTGYQIVSAPPSQQFQTPQICVGVSAGDAATGTGAGATGREPQPGSRSVSAAHGGISSGGVVGLSADPGRMPASTFGMAPPPPPQAGQFGAKPSNPGAVGSGVGGSCAGDAQRPAPAPPQPHGPSGGMVYYHPGDTAGQQMLERILQQQRRIRGAARHPDGSGTDRPPGAGAQAPGVPPFSFGGEAAVAAAAAAAAAWAEQIQGGEADDEAVGLWQQQQMLQGGTAAFAFEQAMQMLLARRRMGDGVSNINGERGAGGEEGQDDLMPDDADSEEVVSNTVNLNVTAFTGASCHRGQAGTARGARRRGKAEAAAARPLHSRGGEEEQDEDGDSPGGFSPQRSAGDEPDPFAHDEADEGREAEACRTARRAVLRNRGRGDANGEEEDGDDDHDEAMDCEGDAGGDQADAARGGSPAARPQRGGCAGRDGAADGDGCEDARIGVGQSPDRNHMQESEEEDDGGAEDGNGQQPDCRPKPATCQAPPHGRHGDSSCAACAGRGGAARTSGMPVSGVYGSCHHCGAAASVDAEMATNPRGAAPPGLLDRLDESRHGDRRACYGDPTQPGGDHALGVLHKRRRSGSGSLDWE